MFELGDKFNTTTYFQNKTTESKVISRDYYPNTHAYSIERGSGWKGSAWEKVYKKLRKKSPTYLELITPYENDKAVTYTFQSTDGSTISTEKKNHTKKAIASTYVNLTKYKYYSDHITLVDKLAKKYAKDPNFHLKLHITSDFFDNERNQKLNDLGRAINIIHEGVHASIHYSHPYPEIISNLHGQHKVMGEHYINDIKKSLKEFDDRLSKKEIFTLSISGLTAKSANGDALIVKFAAVVLGKQIKISDESEIENVFRNNFLPMYRELTEKAYETQK